MMEFKNILFPIDLAEVSQKLTDHVCTFARKFGARVHLLYVVRTFEPYPSADYVPGPHAEAARAELLDSMRVRLDEVVNENFNECEGVEKILSSGHTAREILRYIDENGIDLVIMGTHGRRGLNRVLFGSVAQRVVQSSKAPVLTVNPYN